VLVSVARFLALVEQGRSMGEGRRTALGFGLALTTIIDGAAARLASGLMDKEKLRVDAHPE
jgi:hypothetical protein